MENPATDLAFKGSISEAIAEAKSKMRIFLVYITGKNEESLLLEKSTWTNANVAESIQKHCVFLHLNEGSVESLQFSAIYPVKVMPCISAVGYNGLLLWQNEGYTSAEALISGIKKAWSQLHFKEAAAAILAASLTSEEPVDSGPSGDGVKLSEGSSSVADPSSSSSIDIESRDLLVKSSSDSIVSDAKDVTSTQLMGSTCNHGGLAGKELLTSADDEAVIPQGASDPPQLPAEIHLNVRLLNGACLQEKFSPKDTLEKVKNYIDQNYADVSRPYSLAIPYPRRVFLEQDLDSELSELGFVGREALILVPHNEPKASRPREAAPSVRTEGQSDSSDNSSSGLFGFIGKVLSFFNPFTYLGGSTNSSQESAPETGFWQYRPDPALRSSSSGQAGLHQRPPSSSSSSAPSSEATGSRGKKTTASWGSNIHTLKHDDGEKKFPDRNAFWNGNSTQYGGSNDK